MAVIEALEVIDRDLFLYLNGIHNNFFDGVMFWISGKKSWIPFYVILLYPLWLVFKKKIYVPMIAIGMLILLADQLSVHLFKEIVERYRPCHNLEIKDLVHIVNNKCGGKYGFISSHATNVFALAVFLSLQFRSKFRWLVYLMLIWAVVVSYSRIYLGVHYPADITAGAFFGSIIAWIIHLLMHNLMNKLPHGNAIDAPSN